MDAYSPHIALAVVAALVAYGLTWVARGWVPTGRRRDAVPGVLVGLVIIILGRLAWGLPLQSGSPAVSGWWRPGGGVTQSQGYWWSVP